MANIVNYLKHIRLDFRPSSFRMTRLLMGIILFGCVSLALLHSAIQSTEAENAELTAQAAQLEHENTTLDEKIQILGTVQGVVQIAQDELGLVAPDTVLIQPGN